MLISGFGFTMLARRSGYISWHQPNSFSLDSELSLEAVYFIINNRKLQPNSLNTLHCLRKLNLRTYQQLGQSKVCGTDSVPPSGNLELRGTFDGFLSIQKILC